MVSSKTMKTYYYLFLSALAVFVSCGKNYLEDETVPVGELIPRKDITLTRT